MPYSPYYFQRNNDAENAGFALGCRESFNNNARPTWAFGGKYTCLLFKTNYYPGATNNGKNDWTVDLGQWHELTTQGVWRDVRWGAGQGHFVFDYLDIPNSGSTGLKSRRVHMQVDHDSDNDYHISDESGHIYLGFQVFDSDDDVRGFVFVEASFDPVENEYMMLSSMYLLDNLSSAAKDGILPDPYL